MWKYLADPNILPLLGVTITPFQLVSSWMAGGDLPEYIKKNPGAGRRGVVGIPPAASSRAHPGVTSYPTSLRASATFTPAM